MPSCVYSSFMRSRTADACAALPGSVCCSRSGTDTHDDHAVDRPARPVLAQQCRKPGHAACVGFGVAVLRGVAAGGVEQHGVVGEPPVAVARAADAADRLLAELLGERKAQARVDQRRRLARARRADEHVPRQLVQVCGEVSQRTCRLPTLAGPSRAARAQRLHRLLEALAAARRDRASAAFLLRPAAVRRAAFATSLAHEVRTFASRVHEPAHAQVERPDARTASAISDPAARRSIASGAWPSNASSGPSNHTITQRDSRERRTIGEEPVDELHERLPAMHVRRHRGRS